MKSVGRLRIAFTALGVLGVSGAARAEMTACTVIATVPYTISTSGAYCLDRNVTLSASTGNAILINASTVTLDLNGFTIEGTAGATTRAYGITATGNRADLTVRNGRIKGFYGAIFFNTAAGQGGHLIEGIQAENCTRGGIYVEGKGSIVRQNVVIGTGGTDDASAVPIYGIYVTSAQSARVLNNDVMNTAPGLSVTDVVGITTGTGSSGHLEGNRVSNSSTIANATGIRLQQGALIEAVASRIANFPKGIDVQGSGSPAKLRDNLTSGSTTPFQGNYVDAGNNQ